MVIHVQERSVRIVCSNNYIDGDEYDLAETFNITYKPHFIPMSFVKRCNLSYKGNFLPFEMYMSSTDTQKRLKSKLKFYKSFVTDHLTFDFKQELMHNAYLKLQLLSKAMLFFLKESFNFQLILKTSFLDNLAPEIYENLQNHYINPFNNPICSISGLIFEIFGVHCKNYIDLYSIKNEFGQSTKTVSRIEHQYTSFMHFKFPDRPLISAFSSDKGQKYFLEAIPDMYCEETKTCFFLNGCKIHCHLPCRLNPGATLSSMSPFGKTYEAVNTAFETKLENLLLRHCNEVNEIKIEWECNFREKMKSDPEMKYFFDHHYINHPLSRLAPRDTMRGPFVDTYHLKWSKIKFPDETFFAADINGLYSYCAINYPFMIGKYKVIMGKELINVKVKENHFYFNEKRIMGSILLSIIPPNDLKYPFLPYRKLDGTSVNALCKKCAESSSKICHHTLQERSLLGSYMLTEIEFALTLGYQILNIFEVHAYTAFDNFLAPFVKCINMLKTAHSDLFLHCINDEEKEKYCDLLNKEMNLTSSLKLTPSTNKPNKSKRNFYKFAANSFFGKFAQNQHKNSIVYVSNQTELEKLALSNEILDIFQVSDQVCMVSIIKDKKLNCTPNLKHQLYVGSQITAYARQKIYEELLLLTSNPKCTLYHVNCDSLFYSLSNDCENPLKFNDAVGNFKNVYTGEILSYITFGPRKYTVMYRDDHNFVSETHISGFSLHQIKAEYDFHSLLANLLEKHEKHIFEKFLFPQIRKKIDLRTFNVKTYSEKFSLTNNLTCRRYLCLDHEKLLTLPFGFSCDRMQ